MQTNILVDFGLQHDYLRQIVVGASQFCRRYPEYRVRTGSSIVTFLTNADAVAGVIAFVETPDANHPATRHGKPIVNVCSNTIPVAFPTVATDNRAIGELAAEHLIQQGYRSFACHMDSRYFFSNERCAGFCRVIKTADYLLSVLDTSKALEGHTASPYSATVSWLRTLPMPLGLFTHHDLRAAALLDLCHDAKLNVPNDVGIIGVDNDEVMTTLSAPNLSSVDPATSLIGYRACELLAQLIRGGKPPKDPIFMPPRQVVVRESTEPLGVMDERLSAALRFIRKEGKRMLTIDELLEAIPSSRRSLERLFKTHLGHSPAKELVRVRMNHAKWMIAQRKQSLTDISEACGYNSFRNFATAFRREVGLTPNAFRRKFNTMK